ncbi:MAG: serine hydrolase domain-containing protein [Acidobacteriota bacterium]
MQKLRLLTIVTLLLAACCTACNPGVDSEDTLENTSPETSSRSLRQDDRTKNVDEIFSDWDTAETPGAVLEVIRDGRIIYQRAYGMADLERDVPLSLKSVFDIASTSKQFVAMSILLLQEQDKMSLHDDVRKHLPEIPDYGQTITVRHLIHHTSGIRDYMDLMVLAGMKHENSYHPSVIIDLIVRQKALNFEPGEEFHYSNSGYLLLAEIIERVSGQTLGEFTGQHIFRPLGMNASHFYDDFTRTVKNRALSYSRKETGGYASIRYIFDVVGDTGLLTTLEDLFLWDQNFYLNKLGEGGSKLIEQVQTPGRLNSGKILHYAFGLEIETYRGLSIVKHSGSAAGYRSEMLRFPGQKFTVIVLSNLAGFSPTTLAEQVADLYLADEYTAGPEDARTEPEDAGAARSRVEPDMGAGEHHAYGGHYYSAELDATYVVRRMDGKLRYHLVHSRVETPMVRTGRDTWDADDAQFLFLRENGEAVTGLSLSAGRIRDLYFERIR